MTLPRSLGGYDFPPRDARQNFPAPLLYIGWEDHHMFCSPVCIPVPGDTPFAALQAEILPRIYGEHPDFGNIDWSLVQWLRSGQPWQPDPDATMEENGLGHKAVIRFRTPGLTGIDNSYS